MSKQTYNTAARILNALNSCPGATVKHLATMTKRHPVSIAKILPALRQTGQVVVVGKRMTGQRGKPAFKYATPASAHPSPISEPINA